MNEKIKSAHGSFWRAFNKTKFFSEFSLVYIRLEVYLDLFLMFVVFTTEKQYLRMYPITVHIVYYYIQ